MIITDIGWCDSTVNPTSFACDGCELWIPRKKLKRCYAGKWAERVGGLGAFDEPIELKPGRMAAAAQWPDLRGTVRPDKPWIPKELPRLIFLGDMADTFSKKVPFDYLRTEVVQIAASPAGRRHIWLWLTKRPKRMAEFTDWLKKRGIPWPENLWCGTSITSRKTLPRVAHLLNCGGYETKRFLSLEPLWESLCGAAENIPTLPEDVAVVNDYTKGLDRWLTPVSYYEDGNSGCSAEVDPSFIDWVLCGGESGHDAKPCYVEWLHEIVTLCANASLDGDPVPCFVKQLGSYSVTHNANTMDYPIPTLLEAHGTAAAEARVILQDKKGSHWHEWPEQLQVRQFPRL